MPVPYDSSRSNYWSFSGRDPCCLGTGELFFWSRLLLLSECEPATGPENALLKIDGDRFLLSFHVSGITTVLNVNFVGTFL